MDSKTRKNLKRKPSNSHENEAAPFCYDEIVAQSNVNGGGVEVNKMKAAVLLACRAALVKSASASRAVLKKYQGSVDPSLLVQMLEVVGGYEIEEGGTTLHAAIRNSDVATAQYLLMAGAEVYAMDNIGRLPSRFASCEGCRDLLDHHIRIQADVVHDPNILVAAAVAHCAALSVPDDPQRKRDSYLKEITLDPSYLWVPAATRAIIIAWARDTFTAQQAATVETFLELPDDCGGDVLEFLDTKMTRKELLHAATQVMSQEAIAWVRAVIDAAVAAVVAAEAAPILVFAAKVGDVILLEDCLEKGADVDAQDKATGTAALFYACDYGHTSIVKHLLDAGASAAAKNTIGDTALIVSSIERRYAIVKLLLEAGADINEGNDIDRRPVFWASYYGNAEMLRFLLDAGADVEAEDMHGNNPLIIAAKEGDIATVKLLVMAGADKEAHDKVNFTLDQFNPFHYSQRISEQVS